MLNASLSHVDCWIFDLDHTLYPQSMCLFDQISEKIRHFVMRDLGKTAEDAENLRHDLWERYGTTLAGLMAEHEVDVARFLHDVHDVDLDDMHPDPVLRIRVDALPGRKIVFTNGPIEYAHNVLAARGLNDLFDAVYGCEDALLVPKPQSAAFDAIITKDKFEPTKAAMFEDSPRNLEVPHALGMRTIHVAPTPHGGDHIHHHTTDISAFLDDVRRAL